MAAGILIAGLLWLMQVILMSRNISGRGGFTAAATYVTDSMTGRIKTKASKLAVDDNFYRQCQIASLMPKAVPYVKFQYVLYVLARPIPRALWKNKPVDGGFALHYFAGEGASLSATLIGELYQSYGLFACAIGGLLLGRLAGLGSALFYSQTGTFSSLIYGYVTTWLLVGFRSMQDLMLFSYPMIALVLLSRYILSFTRVE
jgi:hypothetical protein